jgi:PPOX class probable FMN-dependent enzyme
MTDTDGSFVTTINSLAAHYAQPTERILKKRRDQVSALGRAFIAASPFLVLATGSREGLDCSPKGDRPGFVEVSDDGRTLLIPDRRGNNLIDSLRNLVDDPRIGLIFFVPGVNETYRVNGRARISTDADLRRRLAVNGKEPATVMVVTRNRHLSTAQRRWSAPTCGRREVAAGHKAYRRWATSWRRATQKQMVPRSTPNTADACRTSFTNRAAARGRQAAGLDSERFRPAPTSRCGSASGGGGWECHSACNFDPALPHQECY